MTMNTLVRDSAITTVARTVDAAMGELVALSHRVHGYAEIAFEEERSARDVSEQLSAHGFEVESGVGGLSTAFVASTGMGSLTVALCAEYDALPGLGHACGHNVIAASAVGAALALQAVADDLDLTVKVIGTPAEEGGGGKILLLDAGVFDGTHAALMAHPAPADWPVMPCIAIEGFDATFTGRVGSAHKSQGDAINAGNAMTVTQVALAMLRQELDPTSNFNLVANEVVGTPSMIPAAASGALFIKAGSLEALEGLRERVRDCFEAGARATGASLTLTSKAPARSEFRPDPDLVRAWMRHALRLGRTFEALPRTMGWSDILQQTGATDMANVSHRIPSIHPLIKMETGGVGTHDPEFAKFAASPAADAVVRDASALLACTVIEAACDAPVRERLVTEGLSNEDPDPLLAEIMAGQPNTLIGKA